MEILSKQYIPGRGHILLAKAEGELHDYMGRTVEFEGNWWTIINAECFYKPTGNPQRNEDEPVGFIVQQGVPPNNKRKKIFDTLEHSLALLLYYDRKEDCDLPVGAIEESIDRKEVTIEELTEYFKQALIKAVAEE